MNFHTVAVYTCLAVGLTGASGEMRAQVALAHAARESVAIVTGAVIDHLAGRPLPDATVQLVATSDPTWLRTIRTDAAGRFRFDTVPTGRYMIGFEHPRLDALLLRPPVRSIEVTDTRPAIDVELAVPPPRVLMEAFCGPQADSTSAGLLLGRLWYTGNGPASQTADADGAGRARGVRASWRLLEIDDAGARTRVDSAVARLELSATFVLCGLPRKGAFTVQGWWDADSSMAVELELPEHGVLARDLFVGRSLAGRGLRLTGEVRDAADAPVAGAYLRSIDAPMHGQMSPPDEVATDRDGRFVLDGLRSGTQTIEVRAVGYLPRRVVVDVLPDSSTSTIFVLQKTTATLSAVTVTAARSFAGFEARRQRRAGAVFLDEETIRQRKPWVVADLMKLQPGVVVLPTTSTGPAFYTRFGRRNCEPSVFVNGAPLLGRTRDLDAYIDAGTIRAVEIYTVPAEIPPEFPTDGLCGAIVIWTRH